MFIVVPNNFFIPVKYIDKAQLHLYCESLPQYDEKLYPYKKSKKGKKSKKCKNRDSIIDYFRDMESDYEYDYNNYDENFNYQSEIFREIDDEYSLESITDDPKYKDLFLELDNENIEEV